MNVPADRLLAWEEQNARPTVRQAKTLAKTYRQPFAAFYLSEPPEQPLHLPRDYRRASALSSKGCHRLSASTWDGHGKRRSIALELVEAGGIALPRFELSISMNDGSEEAGAAVRLRPRRSSDAGSCRNPRIAFKEWREHAEAVDILVLQTADIKRDGASRVFAVRSAAVRDRG